MTGLNEIGFWHANATREPNGDMGWGALTDRISILKNAIIEPAHITILAKININQIDDNYTYVVSKQKDTYSTPWTSWDLNIYNAGTRERVEFNISDGTFYQGFNSGNFTFTSWYGNDVWLAGIYDGTTQHIYIISPDGEVATHVSQTPGIGSIGYWNTDMNISRPDYWASQPNAEGFKPGDYLKDLRIWAHGKTEDQLRDIVRNPSAALMPVRRPFHAGLVAAPVQPVGNPIMFGANF